MLPDAIIELINGILFVIAKVFKAVMNLLPNSPFNSVKVNTISNEYLGHLAWVIPFESILSVFSMSLAAVSIYYIYQVLLRWIKAVE